MKMKKNNIPESSPWRRGLRCVRRIDSIFRKIAALILLTAAAFTCFAAYDTYSFTKAGINTVDYHSFDELCGINPDTIAWIRINGTNIDHPVVQGKDNSEYLDKDFYGRDYAGGAVFLDEKNSKDLSDEYLIIHGHHMAGGAMFGDLGKFMNKTFFEEHPDGELLTRDAVYELEIEGVFEADAYDSSVYFTEPEYRPVGLADRCIYRRCIDFGENDKLVALSTCSGEMNNKRTLVLARARFTGENNEQHEGSGKQEIIYHSAQESDR